MSNILHRADQIVNHRSEEKERQYGPFAECMDRATVIYNAMSPKEEQISSLGLYRALIALKLSREAYAHKEDNLLDACAYMGAMNHALENSWPKLHGQMEVIEWWAISGSKQDYFDALVGRVKRAVTKGGYHGNDAHIFIQLCPSSEPILALEVTMEQGTRDVWLNKELFTSLNIIIKSE